ncbi:hypothetical protein C8F04DRAFT_1396130 [Mycena alexandri]|uniref:Uncharacterized protein n=1 Tax=Mycena alexandri TaxID=1745969 RepID=A0AAD6X3A1_9AGAR|nr:hypothetical protein C8F04DRAFT_1396130 [Mycena alexandri]
MLPACLPVQELWDRIIDQLYHTPKDAHSCSLVCRSFVEPSQSLIFRDFFIARFGSSPTRLADIFTLSPHLIRHARTLVLGDCDVNYVAPIVTIPWSSLRRLELCGMSRSSPALEEIYTLVELPSLRHLVFDGRRWTANQILAILSHCTPTLHRIEFRGCHPQPAALASVSSLPPTHRRPVIRHLALHDSSSVSQILADPGFPLDMSGLAYLQSDWPMLSAPLLQVLLPAYRTLQTLEFQHTSTSCDFVDLTLFPALCHIKLGDFWVPLADGEPHPHIQMISRLPAQNAIHTISLWLFLEAYASMQWETVDALARDLRALHDALLSDKMPTLRCVEVEVASGSALRTLGLEKADWQRLIVTAMPTLHQRGILSINPP